MTGEIFKETNGGLEFSVYLTPGSQKESVNGIFQDEFGFLSLKISVHSRPTNNEANDSLVKFIASTFRTSKSSVLIKSGLKSRRKIIYVRSVSITDIPHEIIDLAKSYSDGIKKQLSIF